MHARFARILNTLTAVCLDLIPKTRDMMNPMSIKIYRTIGNQRFIVGPLRKKKTEKDASNNTKVIMIG